MIDPQENIVIGNFLYALGLGVGCRAGVEAPPAAVNLLQQTSYDPALGDVMLRFPGCVRLLEFKRRNRSDRPKELEKHLLLRIALAGEDEALRVSRVVHLYVETSPGRPEFRFRACPYLDLDDGTIGVTRLDDLVNGILDEALGQKPASVSARQCHQYIRDVVGVWGSATRHSSTGLLVSVGGGGRVHYAVVEDLADLARTPEQALALQVGRFQALHRAVEKMFLDRAAQRQRAESGREREPRSIDQGHDRSHG